MKSSQDCPLNTAGTSQIFCREMCKSALFPGFVINYYSTAKRKITKEKKITKIKCKSTMMSHLQACVGDEEAALEVQQAQPPAAGAQRGQAGVQKVAAAVKAELSQRKLRSLERHQPLTCQPGTRRGV